MQVFHLGCMDRWIWKRNNIYLLKLKKKPWYIPLIAIAEEKPSRRKDGRIFPEQLKSALNLKKELKDREENSQEANIYLVWFPEEKADENKKKSTE